MAQAGLETRHWPACLHLQSVGVMIVHPHRPEKTAKRTKTSLTEQRQGEQRQGEEQRQRGCRVEEKGTPRASEAATEDTGAAQV